MKSCRPQSPTHLPSNSSSKRRILIPFHLSSYFVEIKDLQGSSKLGFCGPYHHIEDHIFFKFPEFTLKIEWAHRLKSFGCLVMYDYNYNISFLIMREEVKCAS